MRPRISDLPYVESAEALSDDKQEKSSVCIIHEEVRGIGNYSKDYIEVKDDTSEKAYATYLKLKGENK